MKYGQFQVLLQFCRNVNIALADVSLVETAASGLGARRIVSSVTHTAVQHGKCQGNVGTLLLGSFLNFDKTYKSGTPSSLPL